LKFKYLAIAFIIIIVLIILVTVLFPLLLSWLQTSFFTVDLRYVIIPLFVFMALFLASISIFFLLNYRLLSLLEREDWPALAYYLEQKVFIKKRYKHRYVKLLASSYLVISDFSSVIKLESKAMLANPSVVSKNVLLFGCARVLNGNHAETMAFFRSHLAKCSKKDNHWVRWYHGFSSLLTETFGTAESEFSFLSIASKDALITGLSAYFLSCTVEKRSINPQKCHDTAETGKQRVRKAINSFNEWINEAKKHGTDVHIAIIKKYIDESGKWLYDLAPPVVEIPEEIKPKERRSNDRRKSDRRSETRYSEDRRKSDRRTRGNE